MNDAPQKPDVFLSYNKADADWVEQLASRIESETIDGELTGRKLRVFFAPWDIGTGQNIVNRINDGLRNARFVALVMSPEFFESAWCNLEWTHVVSLDPANTNGQIIPVHRRTTVLGAPLNAWNWLDFRTDDRFETEFARLINAVRGRSASRGRQSAPTVPSSSVVVGSVHRHSWKPDEVTEVLVSNLLPVTSYPTQVWSADTEFRDPKEIFEVVKHPDSFILKQGKLYTFARLSADGCSLREVVDVSSISQTPENTSAWLSHPDKKLWLMTLLNKSLNEHMRALPTWKMGKGRFFFPPDQGGVRRWKNPGDQSREVAGPRTTSDGGVFWVHQCAAVSFKRFGDRFFILIVPGFTFTSDGSTALSGKSTGRLSIQWGGRQKNPDVLRSVVFWAKAIASGNNEIRISAGVGDIIASPLPATAATNVGIIGDHIQVGALLKTASAELDEVAADVDVVVEEDAENEENEDDES